MKQLAVVGAGPIDLPELTGRRFFELLKGELGHVESVRFIETQPSVKCVLGFKEPTYGKAQWKSEVNRHRRHK